ncbi:MAG: protein-L-isoaspartate O-methyltransferase [Parcubacteria group bacterium]
MSKLVNDLMKDGYLKSDLIIDAFFEISRIEFVPKELEGEADENVALPIGFGQTISQPLTVAFMFELLDPKRGQKILDVGSGSGWTTALLSYIVGSGGKVIGVERIEKLKKIGEKNADKYGYVEKGIAEFYAADGNIGFPPGAPFDRILVSASTDRVPVELKKQLKIGGKMVIPIRGSIWYLEKKSETDFYKEEYPGFVFVPLIEETNF